MVSQFEEFGLLPQLVQAVEQLGFEEPTPVQFKVIPALLEGRNVVAQAQTGTGKTAAFALPMLQQIEPGKKGIQALVLTPTRELAIQVAEAIDSMARNSQARVMAVYGGQSYQVQTRQIDRGVQIVVATPGRLMDLMRQELLDLSPVRFIVLDEADEMLAMGFIEDVETILAAMPGKMQIALFSATLPAPVRKLANRYMNEPLEILINPAHITVAETEQRYCLVREEHKLAALTRLLEVEDVRSGLIFARTKIRAQELSDELNQRGYPAESLHGDLNQARRESVLNRFRQNSITLLVATDVAARGLDIENVSHVFNYDMPDDTDDYVHRIGRTGRAGRKGIAITFLTPRERSRLKQIETFTHQAMKECRVPTREDIMARRDERFLIRLTEQLSDNKNNHERALIAKLEETSFDLVEIAAAAMRLARQGEKNNPLDEIFSPAIETRPARSFGGRDGKFSRPEVFSNQKSGRDSRGARDSKGGKKMPRSAKGSPLRPNSEPGMVTLWMNLGNENGLRPGDVVGAIASEVGIPGRAIGEISIQKDHTFVDVAEQHVNQVLRESGGQYSLRGKPVMLKLAN